MLMGPSPWAKGKYIVGGAGSRMELYTASLATPTIVFEPIGISLSGPKLADTAMVVPTGFWFGKNRRTKASFTTITGNVAIVSWASTYRPARINVTEAPRKPGVM